MSEEEQKQKPLSEDQEGVVLISTIEDLPDVSDKEELVQTMVDIENGNSPPSEDQEGVVVLSTGADLPDRSNKEELVQTMLDIENGNPPKGLSEATIKYLLEQKKEVDAKLEETMKEMEEISATFEKDLNETLATEIEKIRDEEKDVLDKAMEGYVAAEESLFKVQQDMVEEMKTVTKEHEDLTQMVEASKETTSDMKVDMQELEDAISRITALIAQAELSDDDDEEEVELLGDDDVDQPANDDDEEEVQLLGDDDVDQPTVEDPINQGEVKE